MEPLTSPYVGLIPYAEKDAPIFFGRDVEKRTIAFNLRGSRLTILYGPSGVGKSSVLGAGVYHDLHLLSTDNLKRSGQAELIVASFNSWGEDPVKGLINRIVEAIRQVVSDFDPGTLPAASGLVAVIEKWTAQLNIDLLIILDQFEEYFLYQRQEKIDGSFAAQFARAYNKRDLRVHFLISIREDAVASLDAFKTRIPSLFDNYLRVERLKVKDARAAILQPIIVYNKLLTKRVKELLAEELKGQSDEQREVELQRRLEEEHYSVQSELVDEVCKQVLRHSPLEAEMAGVGNKEVDAPIDEEAEIEAPLLQAVMLSIWEEEVRQESRTLRVITLEALGEAKTIVRDWLNRELGHRSDKDRALAAAMFHHLVTPTGLKLALTLKDLAGYTGQQEEELNRVLTWLSGNVRILRTVDSTFEAEQAPSYEVFHDVLAKSVLEWMVSYRHEEDTKKEKAVLAKRQEESRKKADADLKKAQEKGRRRSRLLLIMFVGFVLLMGMYIYAYLQQRAVARARAELQTERNRLKEEVNYRNQVEKEIPYYKAVLRGHTNVTNKAVFSPDGIMVATASDDQTVKLWDISNVDAPFIRTLQHYSPVEDVTFSPSGKLLATIAGGYVYIWDVQSSATPTRLKGFDGRITEVAFSRNEELIAGVGEDPIIRIWNIRANEIKYELKGHTGPVVDVEFSQKGDQLVTASIDHTARVWRVGSNELPVVLRGHINVVNTAAFSSDSKSVVTASDDWTGRVWDSKTGKFKLLVGHRGAVHSAEFSPDSRFIATSSADQTGRVWDLRTGQNISLLGHSDDVITAHFDKNGWRVITASSDHTARIWETSTGKLLYDLKAHFKALNSAYFHPDGKLAATASADTTARIWSVGDAGVLTVNELKVSADPSTYVGPCPGHVRAFGRISAMGTSGMVKARFIMTAASGKAIVGKEKTLTFDGPATKEVGAVYSFGASTSGSFYLEVLFPANQKSQKVDFQVRCESPPAEPEIGNP